MLDAKPAIHLLVIDGFADWEPAHAVAELRRRGHYRVECVGLSMAPVESMGGVRVLPTRTVAAVEPSEAMRTVLRIASDPSPNNAAISSGLLRYISKRP